MSPSQLIAALIDARLFGLQERENYITEALTRLGVEITFASDLASEVTS